MKDASDTYIAKEEAPQRKPVELYHIWRDGGENWYYTSGDVAFTYDGNSYVPATLKRTGAKYDSQLEVTRMAITASYLEDPVIKFIAINPIEILWIEIKKLFRDQDPLEASVVFIGQKKNVSFQGNTGKVECVGFEHFLKMPVPTFRYQITCNHKLFDTGCRLTKTSYKISTAVTLNADKTQLTSSDFGAKANGYFIRGHVDFGVESRMIVAHIGNVVTLAYKMVELASGDTVDVYPGCDGRIETCKNKYDNVVNFLGFPFIPKDNPVTRIP